MSVIFVYQRKLVRSYKPIKDESKIKIKHNLQTTISKENKRFSVFYEIYKIS